MQNFNSNYGTYGYTPAPNPYTQPRTNQYAFVNGIEGAKSFQMQPNQMVMLLDSDNPIIYKKTSNGYGQASIECFKMVQISEDEIRGVIHQPNQEYALKSDFDALVKRIDELTQGKGGVNNG
ncbi:MAG: hypothetical protein IKF82_01195 [Bacilli bacterium]|nr:hypothetical protein [Bacilli bacterium]